MRCRILYRPSRRFHTVKPVPGPNVCLAFLEDMLPARGREAFMKAVRAALNPRLLERYEGLYSR